MLHATMEKTPHEKLFYRIGEVSRVTQVEPYVLRYWESEFDELSPPKNRSGQRVYRPQDIETIRVIKSLLRDQGFTIAGAKSRLRERPGAGDRSVRTLEQRVRELEECLRNVAAEVNRLLTVIEKDVKR